MSKIKPAELVANWKAISALVLLVLTLIGCAGSPKIQVEVERPPNLDVSGIKRIAVMPGNDKYFEAGLIEMLKKHFTVADTSEKNVDATLYWDVSSAHYHWKTSSSASGIIYRTIAEVKLNYHIKTADGRTIGPISKEEHRWSNNYPKGKTPVLDFYLYPSEEIPYQLAINYLLIGVAEDIAPYKVAEQRTFAEDKTGASGVKDEMKKALAYVEAEMYLLALESYLGIYERHKSRAAAENASILYEFFGDTESALNIMQKAYNETSDPAIQQVITRLSKNLEYKAQVVAIKPAQQSEKEVAPTDEKPISIISGELTDSRDGKKYKTVKIGEQTWMAENLNYDAKGSMCYDKKPANCEKYGRLYNWETAESVCPSGWHLPSDEEWMALINAVGGSEGAGKKLKAKSGWKDTKMGSGNGTDNYGFSALPGGHRSWGYKDIDRSGYWWSASDSSMVCTPAACSLWRKYDEESLLSVRCLQQPLSEENSDTFFMDRFRELTDARDGKKYKTVKIGEQTWMAENLNYDAKGSVCYDKKPTNCKKYGRLYNWKAAMNKSASSTAVPSGVQGVCPSGWHLPSDEEWMALINAVGGSEGAVKKLKTKSGWNKNSNGTNEFGFSALPGGRATWSLFSDDFNRAGDIGYWWSSSEYDSGRAYGRYTDDEKPVGSSLVSSDLLRRIINFKDGFFSVRCVQD